MMRRWLIAGMVSGIALMAGAEDAITARVESFAVMPSTGPVVHVSARNATPKPLAAAIRVQWPDGWTAEPDVQRVELAPGSVVRVPFTITQATDVAANRYPVTITTEANGRVSEYRQDVVCATAPYLKPEIDGKLDDWGDAVPIGFGGEGERTTVMACWNRKQVCIAVRVQEERLSPLKGLKKDQRIDAVQFVLASAGKEAVPYEFVVAPESSWRGTAQAFLFTEAAEAEARGARDLPGNECADAEARVRHKSGVTSYEVAVPVSLLRGMRPTTGRTFLFSVLVHDADKATVRDLGTVMSRWDNERDPHFWTTWRGGTFGDKAPFEGNTEFCFSSSIH